MKHTLRYRLTFALTFLAGFLLAALYCKRSKRETAQPYKVYDQSEVDKLQDEIRNRKLGTRR